MAGIPKGTKYLRLSRKDDRYTYFKVLDGNRCNIWCTHGNWEGYLVIGSDYKDKDNVIIYDYKGSEGIVAKYDDVKYYSSLSAYEKDYNN